MYRKDELPNGVRVITEKVDYVRSVSLGVWVKCGSRCETEMTSGTAHFIEHMLFKGTNRRSALDIASAIESLGGVMNAYTGKELTSFYVKVPDYNVEAALDVLADMFLHPRFDEGDIEREKSVVQQEISLLEDTPDDYIHDYCEARFWQGHGLGQPILGRREVVEGFTRSELYKFFRERYCGRNVVITAAGHLAHDRLVKLCEATFGELPGNALSYCSSSSPTVSQEISVLERDLEQVHMIVAMPGPSAVDEKRYAAIILNTILGGSMSSRLFQEIREKRGMAYAVNSFWAPYMETGMFGVYAGAGVKEIREVAGLVLQELRKMAEEHMSSEELKRAKELVKGNYLLSMENTDTRMSRLARGEIYFGRHFEEEEILAAVDRVTQKDILDLAREMFSWDLTTIVAIGPIREKEFFLDILRP